MEVKTRQVWKSRKNDTIERIILDKHALPFMGEESVDYIPYIVNKDALDGSIGHCTPEELMAWGELIEDEADTTLWKKVVDKVIDIAEGDSNWKETVQEIKEKLIDAQVEINK